MAYLSGSSTDCPALFQAMRDFAVANGWTENAFASDGTAPNKKLHINKGSIYLNFRYYANAVGINGGLPHTNAIFCNGSTGYSGAAQWYDQANSPQYTSGVVIYGNSGMVKLDGNIPSWHFFSFSDAAYEALYFVVENPAGIYQHIFAGSLDKTQYGTSTGGAFVTGNSIASSINYNSPVNLFGSRVNGWNTFPPQGYLRIDNGSGLKWAWSADNTLTPAVLQSFRCFDSIRKTGIFLYNQPNSFNSLPVVIPVTVNVHVNGNNFVTSTPWSPVGELPFLYWCNIKTLNPATTFTIATDEYKSFPFFRKTAIGAYGTADPFTQGTEHMGLAIRTDL